jgi:hypothetical protein
MLMRIFVPWIALAAILGVALGGSVVSFAQPPGDQIGHSEKDTAKHSTNAGPQQHEIPKTFGETASLLWERTWEDPVAFHTFILSIFTGVLGVATLTTLAVAIFQLAHSRREFTSAYRPKLRVRKVTVHPLVVEMPVKAQYEVANVGGTDATLMWATVSVEIPREVPAEMFPTMVHGEHLGTANYPPKRRVLKAGERFLVPFDGTSLTYLAQGRFSPHTMIIRGEVFYKDANDVERHTAFERVYRAESSGTSVHRFGKPDKPDPDYEYED